MDNGTGTNGNVFEFEITTRSGSFLVKVDYDQQDKVDGIKRWVLYKDPKGRKLARSGPENDQVLLHKLLFDIPRTHRLEWKNGDTLDCRRQNLQLVDKDGNVTQLEKPEPKKTSVGIIGRGSIGPVAKKVLKELEKDPIFQEDTRALTDKTIADMLKPPAQRQLQASEDFTTLEEVELPEDKKVSDKKGVYWHRHAKKWAAEAFHAKTRYRLGYFDTEEEAANEVANLKAFGPEWSGLKRNQPKKRQGY